ncbi:MAG: CRISPR-associated endonuclease Cas2 [Bacteroidales bacterium]
MRYKKKIRKEISFVDRMKIISRSGINASSKLVSGDVDVNQIDSLDKRIELVISIVKSRSLTPGNMLFFVMYDIEDNRVRTQISKYLIKKGCIRIQKSIYLADLKREKFDEIHSDLAQVQACYDNKDSILIVPISTDYLQSMKMIGKDIDADLIINPKNTIFF